MLALLSPIFRSYRRGEVTKEEQVKQEEKWVPGE